MLNAIRQFFAPVRGASAALLNPEELFRSILTALGSGSFLGILLTVLQAVLANAAAIFPNPLASALATMVLTLVGDLLRRINHVGPAPVPPIA